MKNLKIVMTKLLVSLFGAVLLLGLIGAVNTPSNTSLMNENTILKQKYLELFDKLVVLESTVNEIRKFDNNIYTQVLGLDSDTLEYFEQDVNPVLFGIGSNDNVFSRIDDRAFYASQMFALQLNKLQQTSKAFKGNSSAILSYPTISPIKTRDFVEITSPFGYRSHPIKNYVLFHNGIDISASLGVPVYSTAQGVVIAVTYSIHGYGNKVVIQHEYGLETLYAHLNSIKVEMGQWVSKNQIIGTVGESGLATGTHLHYEIRKDGESCDPLGYFYVNINEELLAMN